MGASESAVDGNGALETLQEPSQEPSRRREDYLQRLGIQKVAGARWPRSAEAPDRLETSGDPREDSADELSVVGDGVAGLEERADVQDETMWNQVELKGQDDFRVNFLRKLSYSKVWLPQAQRPPKHQTVVIFDWDDTLLCTSYLNLKQDQVLPPLVEKQLHSIGQAGKKLLELALKLGHTFLITNAMHGWVEYSAAKYVPELLSVLQRVHVISARTKFEPVFPGEVSKWKVEAFLEVQRQLDSHIITNLISLGDSNFEMDAVHVMGKEFAQALIKTIKFRENPSPEELLKQLELVSQKFERIAENARNLKIGLERKWVGSSQRT